MYVTKIKNQGCDRLQLMCCGYLKMQKPASNNMPISHAIEALRDANTC